LDRDGVAVSGVGAVSAAGLGADALWRAIVDGRVLTGPVTRYDMTGYPTNRAGEVPASALARLPAPEHESLAARYLAAAAVEALRDAALPSGRHRRGRLGLFVGTVMGTRPVLDRAIGGGQLGTGAAWLGAAGGDVQTPWPGPVETGQLEDAGTARPRTDGGDAGTGLRNGVGVRSDAVWAKPGELLAAVREVVAVDGPVVLLAPGCSAGNAAIAAGRAAVASGEVDVALCGGADELSLEVFAFFTSLRALAPDVVRPFDAGRRGTMPGEGAGVLVLESAERLAARGRRPLARVLACAEASDAYSLTQPHPDGLGLMSTVHTCLDRARVEPADVDWVCAHGTGTLANDVVEARAVAKALAGRRRPVVSSVKGQLGHAEGAAAALEAIVAVRALAADLIPGNATLVEPDPECTGVDLVEPGGRRAPVRAVLSQAYGFGGAVSTILLGKGSA
jgi:3-oxoacyl-[acyl-carrier-protein] synthase II